MQAANLGPAQCVLWLDPRTGEPGALFAALSGRGVQVIRVGGPYAALGEVCRLGRSGRRVILLLVEPRSLDESGRVFDAVQRFAPAAACWAYEEGANPKLRAVVESEVEAWPGGEPEPVPPEVIIRTRGDARVASAGRQAGVQPQLRLVDEGGLDPEGQRSEMIGGGASDAADPAGPAPRHMLTPEELAMLLGEDGPEWNADR